MIFHACKHASPALLRSPIQRDCADLSESALTCKLIERGLMNRCSAATSPSLAAVTCGSSGRRTPCHHQPEREEGAHHWSARGFTSLSACLD